MGGRVNLSSAHSWGLPRAARAPPPGQAGGGASPVWPRPSLAPPLQPPSFGAAPACPPASPRPAPRRSAPAPQLAPAGRSGAGPWRYCGTCRCRIRETALSCCSVWGPGPMATFTRCAVRGGRTGGSTGGGYICASRRGSPGPAPSSPRFLPCAPQARDTVTSELAAVKIVKLDPGVGPGGASALQGGGRGRVSWRGRRVDISETPPQRGRPQARLRAGTCQASRETLCPVCT